MGQEDVEEEYPFLQQEEGTRKLGELAPWIQWRQCSARLLIQQKGLGEDIEDGFQTEWERVKGH